jgi:RNA polymerase sigma factor (TIGR02999 family)
VPIPPRPAPAPPGEVTRLLQAWQAGDDSAKDRLIPVVYQELRKRAAAFLRHERRGHTFRPTDLVHETYLRLCAQNSAWENRDQFFGVACRLMRRILVDHARARAARKRSGGVRVTLSVVADSSSAHTSSTQPDLLDLDKALDELAALDERQARLVELRFFGGLSVEEAARALGVSVATAHREWAMAKAWLFRRLERSRRS